MGADSSFRYLIDSLREFQREAKATSSKTLGVKLLPWQLRADFGNCAEGRHDDTGKKGDLEEFRTLKRVTGTMDGVTETKLKNPPSSSHKGQILVFR